MRNLPLFKSCPRCTSVKPLADFPRRTATTTSPGSYCVPCTRAFNRAYYAKSDCTKQRIRVQGNAKKYRDRNRKLLWEYLRLHPCIDCGETDPLGLEFDHVRPKRNNVSNLVSSCVPWSRIEAEIALCEVRCANCHRRKTARQLNWKVWYTGYPES